MYGLIVIDRLPCPIRILAELATIVQADILAQLRQRLASRFPFPTETARQHVGDYAENGLRLLFGLTSEPEFANDRLEACRILAQQDARFTFIYGFPNSAGFGAAIGATLQSALFGETSDEIIIVTALLNVFMTILDGLLDRAPQIISPHLDLLLAIVCSGAAGDNITGVDVPDDHPYNALCFLIAKLWIRKLREAISGSMASKPSDEIAFAIRAAMLAEYANSNACFANGPPVSGEVLYGRTRWPHWVQALACTQQLGWPSGLDPNAFKEFIFRVADYVTYIDDMCDYVADCEALQWNTVSYALYRRNPFTFFQPDDVQRHLLVSLAEDSMLDVMIQDGLKFREAVEQSIVALGPSTDGLHSLLADVTYVYLR